MTVAYRGHGTASQCWTPSVDPGPCTVDTTLFWDNSCVFSSTARSAACDTAWYDPAFTQRACGTTACSWHYGLNSTTCGGICNEFVSNHDGGNVVVGVQGSSIHALSGRAGEDPSIDVWVK